MDQRTEHMKNRCYFIAAMCGASLYSWINYSLFDPIIVDVFSPPYQNCLLMLFYLSWDTYKMLSNPLLFRNDLMIHHCVTFVVYVSYINYIPLQMSHLLIMESISLMNYVWRDNIKLLTFYRTCMILCIRMPLSLWFWLYYNKLYMFPYFRNTVSLHVHCIYLTTLMNMPVFFIFYDVYILWQIYKPKNIKRV